MKNKKFTEEDEEKKVKWDLSFMQVEKKSITASSASSQEMIRI